MADRIITRKPETDPEWAQQFTEDWDSPPPEIVWECENTPFWMSINDGETDGGITEFPEEHLHDLKPTQLRTIADIFTRVADYLEGETNA